MKNPNPPKLVTVAVTTTITIVFWIFFTLYQVLTKEPEPSVDEKLLEPIVPELDNSTLQTLNNRVFFDEGSFVFDSQNINVGQSENNVTVSEGSQPEEVVPEPTPQTE